MLQRIIIHRFLERSLTSSLLDDISRTTLISLRRIRNLPAPNAYNHLDIEITYIPISYFNVDLLVILLLWLCCVEVCCVVFLFIYFFCNFPVVQSAVSFLCSPKNIILVLVRSKLKLTNC